jgi:EpsI family protein
MSKPVWFSFAMTTTLLLGALAGGSMTDRRIPESLKLPLDRIDSQIAGWTQISQRDLPPKIVESLDSTSYLLRTYQKGHTQLDLFIAYYAEQRAGESMHSPKHCLPGGGWEMTQRGSATIGVMGRRVEVNEFVIENLGTKMVMIYWYQSRSRIVANEYLGKLLLVRDTALTGLTGGSIVRITLADTSAAADQGVDFAADIITQMQRCLGRE